VTWAEVQEQKAHLRADFQGFSISLMRATWGVDMQQHAWFALCSKAQAVRSVQVEIGTVVESYAATTLWTRQLVAEAQLSTLILALANGYG
jgi:hypothetical protein